MLSLGDQYVNNDNRRNSAFGFAVGSGDIALSCRLVSAWSGESLSLRVPRNAMHCLRWFGEATGRSPSTPPPLPWLGMGWAGLRGGHGRAVQALGARTGAVLKVQTRLGGAFTALRTDGDPLPCVIPWYPV